MQAQPIDSTLLLAALDEAPLATAILAPCETVEDFRYLYVNEAFKALMPGTDMVGRTVADVWGDAGERFVTGFSEVIRSGVTLSERDIPFSASGGHADAETRYYTYEARAIGPVDDRRLCLTIDDTTDAVTGRQAEREARRSRANLEAALRSMQDAVLISDTEGTFTHINEAFVSFNRFNDPGDVARCIADYPMLLEMSFPDGTPAPFDMWPVPRALRGETATNAEYFMRRKDSGAEWVGSFSFAPIRDGEGHVVGSVVAGRDVTDLKHAETDREALLARLAEMLEKLREKDRAIRKAYSDVIDAVTGGQLVILGKDEITDATLTQEEGETHLLLDSSQLAEARRRLREFVGVDHDAGELELAMSEGLTNMLKHAGGGTYHLLRRDDHLQILMTDEGPGIDFANLPKATLVPGFSTKQTLGMGFTVMMELADRLLLCSDPAGTTLVIEKDLSRVPRPVHPHAASVS